MTSSDLPPLAFVVMPFASEMRRNYERVIRPALERAGVTMKRADEDGGHIHAQMFERIVDADLVVADISGTNPNVFYELGVAHALRERTVMVVREDFAGRIPFDVAPYRVCVFPDPETANADALEAAIAAMAHEVARVAQDVSVIVPNPVQAFLRSRSPLASPRSMFLPLLPSSEQDRAVLAAHSVLAYVGISASSCAKPVLEAIEAGQRTTPLHLRIGILSPDCLDGWRFLYCLRDGHPGRDADIEDFRLENRSFQEGWSRKLARVAQRHTHFTFEIIPIDVPIHFWAFMIDRERILLGYFAMNKEASTGMPASVLVEGDPATRSQFLYYRAAIEELLAKEPSAPPAVLAKPTPT